MQFIKAVAEIEKQSALGWYTIDIFSNSDNVDPTAIKSGTLEIQFAKLNGDGISKWLFISSTGETANIGDYK